MTATCPECTTQRAGSDAFCEACGYDFVSGAALTPPAPVNVVTTWRVTAIADHEHYERVAPEGVDFPVDCGERVFALTTDVVTVGRRSASAKVQPDIDLTGPPLDPGVSHRHAQFER